MLFWWELGVRSRRDKKIGAAHLARRESVENERPVCCHASVLTLAPDGRACLAGSFIIFENRNSEKNCGKKSSSFA